MEVPRPPHQPEAASGEKVGVSLIVKTTTNPFFVAMEDGAKKAAEAGGVDLKLAAGKADGDEDTQIQAIENAISKGDKGILITPNGPSVSRRPEEGQGRRPVRHRPGHPAGPRRRRRHHVRHRQLRRRRADRQVDRQPSWTARKPPSRCVDLFNDKVVSVDYNRDQGFLTGLGIDTADKKKNGDEAKTGKYTGGKGGDYEIVGSQASQGAEDGGRTAMETLLSKNPNINVVYTINEPAAAGAFEALKAAGKEKDVLVVSVDGGCTGVNNVKSGVIGATAQQYPVKMAELGVKAIVDLAKTGKKPANSRGPGLLQHRRRARHGQAGRRRQEHHHHRGLRHLLGKVTRPASLRGGEAEARCRPPRHHLPS